MRKILILSVVLLSGCSSNCFEKASIAQLTIPTAYKATADALESKVISKGTATEALTVIDIAKKTANEAGALCIMDEDFALDKINRANDLIGQATKIIKDNKEI